MPTIDVDVKIKTNRKVNPATGDFQEIAARIKTKAPVITFRTAQALHTMARLTAPQPPEQAWWYKGKNPRTHKVVPPWDQYVRTGHLANSILMLKDGDDWTVEVLAAYAPFVENGTRFMPPQPFFHNSIRHVRQEVLSGLVKQWLRR